MQTIGAGILTILARIKVVLLIGATPLSAPAQHQRPSAPDTVIVQSGALKLRALLWRPFLASLMKSAPNNVTDQTQDAAELSALRTVEGKVSRAGFQLAIRLPAGNSVVLKDDMTAGMPFIQHRYTAYLKRIHSHLIELRRYEGGSYLLVDDSTGMKTRIPGVPVISPDAKRFVSMSFDMGAGYDPNLIEVWNVEARKPHKEFSFESESWGPSDAAWRDPATVDFTQNSFVGSFDSFRKMPARLIHKGSGWTFSKSGKVQLQ